MSTMKKFDFEKFRKETPQRNLRQAAKAYLHTAIRLYIKLEARVSIWNDVKFGDSANIVCSLNRAIEHLLKLRLLKIDPMLLHRFPKNVEEYCCVKQIRTKNSKDIERRIKEKEILSHTISFKEALARVDLTQSNTDYDFRCFNEIYALRNSLEHHWDRNEEFLQKVVGKMSSNIIPCLKEFIKEILKEKPEDYFDKELLKEVERLDRAIERGHSLELQRRLEEHLNLYSKDPDDCKEKYRYPTKYSGLAEEETEVKCPVCKHPLLALWDWEADYDVEGTSGEGYISGAFPDPKCLTCVNCHFFVEGGDIDTYLPDGLDIEFEPDYYDDY
ncbi:hypothetical protein ES705_10323 [subsurface metagenome]